MQINFKTNINLNVDQISKSAVQPIRIKLVNLGDTSYLNSVLYLFGNIKNFKDFFLDKNNAKYITENIIIVPLALVLHRLFLHFYNNRGDKVYKPDSFKVVLTDLNVVYKSNKRRNPNELLSFILDNLHSKLKRKQGHNNTNNNIINQNDRISVLRNGIINYLNSNDSLISAFFNWFQIKESKCQKCNSSIYNFYSFNIYELDILGTYNNNFNKRNDITLNDCIQFQQKFPKIGKLYCNLCKQYTSFSLLSKIFSTPNLFVF